MKGKTVRRIRNVVCTSIVAFGLIAIAYRSGEKANGSTSYYRKANNQQTTEQYVLCTERSEKCVYIGNGTYVTPDGNQWVYDEANERESVICQEYTIVLDDNGTKDVTDDMVVEIR